jgi:hypothetical protein
MSSALPGEARAPGAAEAERVRQEVAHPGWRLDAPAGAKNTEHPPAHLRLAGGPWPWRPATLFALTSAVATGVALLPAAAARRHRP